MCPTAGSRQERIRLLRAYEERRDALLAAIAEVDRCLESPSEIEAAVRKAEIVQADCQEALAALEEALSSRLSE